MSTDFIAITHSRCMRLQGKELVKILVILYTLLCQRKPFVPLILRKLVAMSPISPFLVMKISYVDDIIKYRAREVDVLIVLLLDGVMESVNQLLLVLYFAIYINKTGLDVSNVISIFSNAAGFLLKLAQVAHIHMSRRKDSESSTIIGSSVSSNVKSLAEKSAASVDMINLAFNVEVDNAPSPAPHTKPITHHK